MESIYDYPLYYDILFGWNRDEEASFYHNAFIKHGVTSGARVLEVCSGTGQIGLRLASHGWQVTGLDIRESMVEFMEAAAVSQELTVRTILGDMRNFASHLFDCACCPLNSLRLLQRYEDISAHLNTVSFNLREGGVYILDMHFSPPEKIDLDNDLWTMKRDGIEVTSLGDTIQVNDGPAGREMTLDWGGMLQRYAYEDFAAIIGRSGGFDIESCHPVHRVTHDGTSVFHVDDMTDSPDGRTMVVLTRVTERAP